MTSGIRRSLELTRNSWCYVFCCYFIVGVITIPGQLIWNFAVQMVFGDPNFSGMGFLMSSLWMVVVCPLTAICQSVMYFNLRVEKEGFNADVLWNEFGRGGGAGAGTHVYETLLDDELDNEEEG